MTSVNAELYHREHDRKNEKYAQELERRETEYREYVNALIERVDEYADARQRVRNTSDDDMPAMRAALDHANQAWDRLLDARYEFSANQSTSQE